MPNQDGVLLSAITRGTRRNRRGFESMEFETRCQESKVSMSLRQEMEIA